MRESKPELRAVVLRVAGLRVAGLRAVVLRAVVLRAVVLRVVELEPVRFVGLRVVLRAVEAVPVLFADFRAVDFRVVGLRAVDLRVVDFCAVDLRVVDFRAVDLRVLFLAPRVVVDFVLALFCVEPLFFPAEEVLEVRLVVDVRRAVPVGRRVERLLLGIVELRIPWCSVL